MHTCIRVHMCKSLLALSPPQVSRMCCARVWMHAFSCVVTHGSGGVHVSASIDGGQSHPSLLTETGLSIKPRTH